MRTKSSKIFTNQIVKNDIQEVVKYTKKALFKAEGKNILISGASGMLASYLVYTFLYANQHLFKKPAKLFLVIRRKIKPFGTGKNIFYIHQDVVQPIKKISNLHFIIHAASKAAPKFYTQSMVDTLNTNILGLYNLLSLCGLKTQSFLYFSSGEVYGEPEADKLINEKYLGKIDHLSQRSCYSEGKRAAETIAMNYFWEKRLPIKIVRIFHTFGPGLNLNDGRIFSDFIGRGLKGKNIEIHGDKNIKRAILYLKDATIMFLKIFLSNKNGQVYNVGSDKNIISVETFAKLVCQEFNKRSKKKLKVLIKTKKVKFYQGAPKVIRPDISKFKKDFHYQPETTVKEAISRTIDFLTPASGRLDFAGG